MPAADISTEPKDHGRRKTTPVQAGVRVKQAAVQRAARTASTCVGHALGALSVGVSSTQYTSRANLCAMLVFRRFRANVAGVLALWVLCSGTAGEASSTGVSMWTWMQRAFAPAAHHRRKAPTLSATPRHVDGQAEAGESKGTKMWMQRALTPSAGRRPLLSARGVDGEAGGDEPGWAPPTRTDKSGNSLMREVLCSRKSVQRMAFCAQPVLRAWRTEGTAPTFACARQPHARVKNRPERKHKNEIRSPVQASAVTLGRVGSMDRIGADWRGTTPSLEDLNMTSLAGTPGLSRRQGSLRVQSAKATAPTLASQGEKIANGEAAFDQQDLVHLVAGVHERVKSIQAMMRLPISPQHISTLMDLAQIWQRMLRAHQSLSGSAEDTAREFQAASVMAFKLIADPLTGGSGDRANASAGKTKSWATIDAVLENLVQVSKVYSDSASWLYWKAVELDPRQVPGAVMGISQVTLDTIGQLNKRLENMLSGEVERVLERFDRELLGINRPNSKLKESATCMIMGQGGTARVLRYGEAIPQLLYDDAGVDAFESPMSVTLNTDDKGNLFLSAPGSAGVELPLSSDVMWMRQMAAYSESMTGADGEKLDDESQAPATVAAVTIPVNANGDVLLTQRAFRGMYDGMWVFPGGHVDKGESLMTAAVREVREETGLAVDRASLQPLAVWEGAVSSKKKQFCVVFFVADAMCDNAHACSMELQTKEVHRAAWVSKDMLPRILDTHVLHSDMEIDGVLIENDQQTDTRIKMSELQDGLGEGHKFALRAYLDSLEGGDRDMSVNSSKESPGEPARPQLLQSTWASWARGDASSEVQPSREDTFILAFKKNLGGLGAQLTAAF